MVRKMKSNDSISRRAPFACTIRIIRTDDTIFPLSLSTVCGKAEKALRLSTLVRLLFELSSTPLIFLHRINYPELSQS